MIDERVMLYQRRNALIPLFILNSHFATAENILPEIVVTATRTAQTVNDSLASVTVLTRDQIAHSSVSTVPDLLRTVGGLDVVRNGGIGQASSVFMRGTNSDHVLVLVDGIKIGSATLGQVPFQDLPLAQIERIEIVRGPRSSLYGSEALGGVIQIFTRRGSEKNQGQISAVAGNHNSAQATANQSGHVGKIRYAIGFNQFQSDEFNACRGDLNGGCFTDEPDEDGYQNTSVNARLTYRLSDNVEIEAHGWQARGKTEYDSAFQNEFDFVKRVLGIKTVATLNDRWDMTFQLGENRDEEEDFGHATVPSIFNTQRTVATWQNNWVLSDTQLLTLGYDYQNEEISGSETYTVNSRDNHGYFAEYQQQADNVSSVIGIRNDDNAQFGRHTTGNLTLGYRLTPALQTFIAYGTAFKAPSFNELYYPHFGNSHLVPEKSKNLELGLKGQQNNANWAVSAYYTQIDELIGGFPIENLDQADIIGLEGDFTWQSGDWEFTFTGTWLNAEDNATGHLLPRRAEKTVYMEITRQIGRLKSSLTWLAQSHRYDDALNINRLGGYGRVDIRGDYPLNKNWTLQARLDNIFAVQYETARFYNQPGRTFFTQINYAW